MSEKIYACLLRLFPPRFRQAYGEEALLLFRDRLRDEKGFVQALKLWLDLLLDLMISVPREYRHDRPELIGVSAPVRLDSMPSLYVLEAKLPGARALFFGGVLALVTLSVVPVLISSFGNSRPLRASDLGTQHRVLARSSAATLPAMQVATNAGKKARASEQPIMTTSRFRSGTANRLELLSMLMPVLGSFGFPQPQVQPPDLRDAKGILIPAIAEDVTLDAAERRRVIDAVIKNLKEHYVDPAIANKLTEALLAHEKSGDYGSITDGAAFAALLTRQLRHVSHDMHLEVVYMHTPLPRPTPEGLARYRRALEESNCTFEKVQVLPHNIGYLKLNSFPDPSICGSTAKAAMASLNHVAAIIFDLRDNRGGYPSMVMLIAAYLFDHPEYMYNPRENTTARSWTRSPVPGNRLANKPAYVLTSARTFSGAEHFSYDLKMLKRATLVGETTAGATDVGTFHRIDDHFGMGVRETRPINPYSEPDWAVVGVQPDVRVKAADALGTAERLAQDSLKSK
jgi:hypothetical protein